MNGSLREELRPLEFLLCQDRMCTMYVLFPQSSPAQERVLQTDHQVAVHCIFQPQPTTFLLTRATSVGSCWLGRDILRNLLLHYTIPICLHQRSIWHCSPMAAYHDM